ncbi:uncharacterized protein LOC141910101 [Tubulanus polymorphus]|uniref:uncharacterized protein LOC141910101 n=1 Tax=Tubulanus polymorphus TaxID=672921 RepID=UPI003DA4CEE2
MLSVFDAVSSCAEFARCLLNVVAGVHILKLVANFLFYDHSRCTYERDRPQISLRPRKKTRRRRRADRAHTDPVKKPSVVDGNNGGSVDDDADGRQPQIIYQLFCGKYITIKDSDAIMVGDNCTMNTNTDATSEEEDSENEITDDEEEVGDEAEESGCDTNFDNSPPNLRKISSCSAPPCMFDRNQYSPSVAPFQVGPVDEQFECSGGTFRFTTLTSPMVDIETSALLEESPSSATDGVRLPDSETDASAASRRKEREIFRELGKLRSDDGSITVESQITKEPFSPSATLPSTSGGGMATQPRRRLSLPLVMHSPSEKEMREKKQQIIQELKKLRGEDDAVAPEQTRNHHHRISWRIFTRIKASRLSGRKKRTTPTTNN